MAASATVGIVVLSWNRKARVLALVARLERLTGVAITIIVVDNASSDDSVEMLRRLHPEAVVLPQETNIGFVGGVNAGLREARRLGLAYAWLLNDDTQMDDDLLAKLLAFAAAHPAFGLFSPVVRDDHEERALQFANGVIDWRRSRLHDEAPAPRFDALVADGGTPVLIGTALLIDLRIVKLEGFDPQFFAYWEDIDFCVRCAKAGAVAAVVPDATVLHDSPLRDERPPHYFYYMIRNEALFWMRHARGGALGWRRVWLYKALIWLGESRDAGHAAIVQACTDAVWDALHRRSGQRDLARPAPPWFARVLGSHPHLLVLVLQGKFGTILRRMGGRASA